MDTTYFEREQTAAKHFILRHYLQSLALITLQGHFPTLTYVDGFSGPWKSRTTDFSDTSFMIAIKVLRDIQWQLKDRGLHRTIKCFFVEKDARAFAQLETAVRKYNDPANGFYVETFKGRFEDAIPTIVSFAKGMTLTFIDPTGWKNYAFDKIEPLLKLQPSETLVNFMYDHASRFTSWKDETNTESFNGILRPGWRDRIDKTLPPGEAAERLFRKEFKAAGVFEYALSTPIQKLTDRTHFCITYGTRNPKGVEVYRDVEHRALRDHAFRRFESKMVKAEAATGQSLLFQAADLHQESTFDAQCVAQQAAAEAWLRQRLAGTQGVFFAEIWPEMLEVFMVRKKHAGDICAALAKEGFLEPTWKARGTRVQKPQDNDLIIQRSPAKAVPETA